MKRILAILCVLAMLLSLPIAPGVLAAEADPATPSALVNLWTPLTRTNGLLDASAGVDTNSGSSNSSYSWSQTYHNSSEFMPIAAGETIYWGPALATQGVHVAFAETADADTFTWAGTKAATTVVDTFEDGYQIRSWTAASDGYFAVASHAAVIDDAFFMITKEPVGGDGSQALTVQKYLDYFGNNVYHLNATGKRIAADGTLADSLYYSSTGLIPVTPGETLTLGPIVAEQDTFGHAYDSAKSSVQAITAGELTKVAELDYDTGYYARMGSSQAGLNYQTNYAYLVEKGSAFYTYTVPAGVNYIRATFDIEATPKFMVVRGKMDLDTYKTITGNGTSTLTGKTALFVGDSITHSTQDTQAHEGISRRGWGGRIADLKDMLVYNYGRTSSSLSTSREGVDKTGRIVDQLDFALEQTDVAFDHVVIAGGVNDIWDSVPVGTATADGVTSGFDETTYAGALEATFAKAKEYFGKTAAISYIINPKVTGYSQATLNDSAYAESYIAVAKPICEKWGVNCIDLYNNETVLDTFFDQIIFKTNSDSSIKTMTKGTGDNLHPNELGYDILAPIIAEAMENATVIGGEAYTEDQETSTEEIVNLWTNETRNWGIADNGTLGTTKFYNGTYANGGGRKNPGHNSSEWIDVEAGDVIYVGGAYYSQAHINWLPEGSTSPKLITNGAVELLESSSNGTYRIIRWTAPANGKAAVINKQNVGNDDFLLVTKNRPFNMVEYMDYFNNNVYIFNTQGNYLNAQGELQANTEYFITEYIKVTPGETLTLGPVVTGTQVAFGHTFTENMKPAGAISLDDLNYQYSFDYATGYYSYSLNGGATSALKKNDTPNLYEYYLSPGADVYTYTVPEGVEYIRACFMTDAKTKAFVLRGTVNQDGYYALNGVSADNPLIGKKALFLGDSITEGAADYAKEGVKRRGWAGRIADKYDMLVDNFGVSGFSFARTGETSILDELFSARHNDYDYVVIHGGVNDLAYDNFALGTVDPEEFDFNDLATNTFAGGMERTIARAKEYFGDTASFVYIWNFEIKNSNWFTGCDNGCQPKYYAVAKAVCEKWGIPMIDLYNDTFVRAEFYDESTPALTTELRNAELKVMDGTYDNVHPNALGYDILAPVIGEGMEKLTPATATAPVDKEDTVITVIGDGLTAGLGSTDVYRKSYPAVLQDLLGEDYQVLNFGISNATVQQDQQFAFANSMIAKYSYDTKADKVVIMLGTNDLKTLNASAPNAEEKLADELTALVKSYQERFPAAEIYLATPPAATNETVADLLTVAAPLYEALATKLGVNFIDVYTATNTGVAGYISDHESADGIWYNDTGYAKIAETVLDAFGLTKAAAPAVDTTAEYTGTYPSVPTVSQYTADSKYQGYDAYRIVTAEDFRAFGDLVAAGDAMGDKTVYLENDLDLAGKNVRPVGMTGLAIAKNNLMVTGTNPDEANAFRGTFNGNGYTINVEFEYYNVGVGLFASTNGATIKNLNLTGSVRGYDNVASLVAFCDGGTTLENIWSGADATLLAINQSFGAGGVAANFRNGGTMINVGYSGTVTGQNYVGGLICYAHASTTAVKNCYFNGKIVSTTYDQQTNILVRNAPEAVHTNNYMIADPKNIIPNSNYATTIDETAFATGDAAVKLNNLGDVWTVKNGKTVIAGPEDKATFTVTVDGNSYYTNHKGQVAAEFKTETGYFRVGNQLVTDAEMSTYEFSKENAILNSVAKLAGDASGDGSFAMDDIIAVMRYLVQHPERVVEVNADYSGNGKINVADCVRMLQAMAAADPVA